MKGALCAIFSGSSSSRKTAPMFVGLIERKAWGAARLQDQEGHRNGIVTARCRRLQCRNWV